MQNHKKFVSTTVQVFLNFCFFCLSCGYCFLLLLFVLQLFSFFCIPLLLESASYSYFCFCLVKYFTNIFICKKCSRKTNIILTLRTLLYSLIRAVHFTVKFCCKKILALISHFKFFIFSDFDKNEKNDHSHFDEEQGH